MTGKLSGIGQYIEMQKSVIGRCKAAIANQAQVLEALDHRAKPEAYADQYRTLIECIESLERAKKALGLLVAMQKESAGQDAQP